MHILSLKMCILSLKMCILSLRIHLFPRRAGFCGRAFGVCRQHGRKFPAKLAGKFKKSCTCGG